MWHGGLELPDGFHLVSALRKSTTDPPCVDDNPKVLMHAVRLRGVLLEGACVSIL